MPAHANGLQFFAYDGSGALMLHEIYYSIGGGFVRRDDEMNRPPDTADDKHLYSPFRNAEEMLEMGDAAGL